MNVLVIAPHPDDEAIGCGGSIRLHAQKGDRVTVVFLTSGELGLKHLAPTQAWRIRESEAEAAASHLGVSTLKFLRLPDWFVSDHVPEASLALKTIIADEMPEIVYVPHSGEWHPDHKIALSATQTAIVAARATPQNILAYEVWTPMAEHQLVQNITSVMAVKLLAVNQYRSQLTGFRYDRAVRGLNQYRGELAGHCRFAEVFAQDI
jgi:LmbE family N-acetylglucosaminyl deacetylase